MTTIILSPEIEELLVGAASRFIVNSASLA